MARILVLTTDLPFFPGKNGHDYFNLRHLALRDEVGVVAPLYEFAPAVGVANLERAVQHVYLWPRPAAEGPLFVTREATGVLPDWANRLPSWLRRRLLLRLVGLAKEPADAYERLAILANCAPGLLQALREGPWDAFVLIQSNLAPWLAYLPGASARLVYFHDVRTVFLARQRAIERRHRSRREIRAVLCQETRICDEADAVGFVSELDRERAARCLKPATTIGVAPIPVDTTYFTPAPPDWPRPAQPMALFTGHLSHPPNVDAARYFLREIWPLVREQVPAARFVIAGLLPAPELRALAASTAGVDLHANVPDIRPFFWDARVFVVPMRYGGGVRQKLFEAWSMQVPVVCTTMAAEGTGARSGEQCWMEDTPAGFAGRVAQVLRGAGSGDTVAAASAFVEARHSIPVAASSFGELIRRTITVKRRRPFRLLYDLRWMEIGRSGGAEQMTRELIAAISRLDHRNEYRLFCPRSTFHEWRFPPSFRVQAIYSDLRDARSETLRAVAANRLAEGLGLAPVLTTPMRTLAALRRLDFDLVHSMVNYIHPDLSAFPHVLTALDLQHVHHPEFFPSDQWRERDQLYREAARRARHILCISEFTRQDMHRHYGVPLERMTTVWVIPGRQSWHPLDPATRREMLANLGATGPFLFFPAHCWLHKNHAKLVETFALIEPHLPKDLALVFTGRPFPEDHPAAKLIRELGLGRRIRHLGYRSPLEVQALYEGCLLLVFPSLFEGFGMPVAEAIIAEKPVACSNRTSLPEIAGEAALTFDPTNIHDMGGRLLEIVNDPQRQRALIAAARRRKPLFSARLSAVKTLAVYQRVYEQLYA